MALTEYSAPFLALLVVLIPSLLVENTLQLPTIRLAPELPQRGLLLLRQLAALQQQFEETTKRKEDLEQQSDDCAKKLDRAQKLIGGLGGEKDRWSQASTELGRIFINVTGDILIGSGVLSYMGPFTQVFRDRVVPQVRGRDRQLAAPPI